MGQLLRQGAAAARAGARTRASPATPSAWPSATALRAIIVEAFAPLTGAAGGGAARGGADRQRARQHDARRLGASAAAGARALARSRLAGRARCRRCCRPAPGTKARAWTRCRRSASTPTRSSPSSGIDAEAIARPARGRGRCDRRRAAICSCRATVPNASRKALASGADAVVLDLEDAVAPAAKAARTRRGRRVVARRCPTAERARVVVRINDARRRAFADDLRLLRDARIGRGDAAQGRDAPRRWRPCAARRRTRGAGADGKRARHRAADDRGSAPKASQRLVFGTLDYALDLDLDIADERRRARRMPPPCWPSHRARAGLAAPVAGVTPQLDDEAGCCADVAGRAATASAPSCASTRAR